VRQPGMILSRFVNFFWRALSPPNTPQRLELSPGRTWDGVGTTRTTQSGRYGPEKLSLPARATEGRWGAFLQSRTEGRARCKVAPLLAGARNKNNKNHA
jgi:hypothetical protein